MIELEQVNLEIKQIKDRLSKSSSRQHRQDSNRLGELLRIRREIMYNMMKAQDGYNSASDSYMRDIIELERRKVNKQIEIMMQGVYGLALSPSIAEPKPNKLLLLCKRPI